MNVVGRKAEIALLTSYLTDSEAHFVSIIGRRRVGKTFLIREVFENRIVFEMTGLKDGDLQKQLLNFSLQLNSYFPDSSPHDTPQNWLLAFNTLSQKIMAINTKQKPVVFLDE